MIAGDIYDKAVPSAKAVTEFDEFLTELADSGTIILIISGNHDSAERLDFASSIMKKQNIYMKGTYGGEAMKVSVFSLQSENVLNRKHAYLMRWSVLTEREIIPVYRKQ